MTDGDWDYYQIYYPEDDGEDDEVFFITQNDQNKKYKYTNMTEPGDGFDENTPLTEIKWDDDDDDQDEEEEENTTQPF